MPEYAGRMTPTTTRAPAVQVLDLTKRYGPRTVVDGVSFEAASGQVTAVLGPNGAGKTTTVECCEGLRRPDGGQVRVLGRDPAHTTAAQRGEVGAMLQDGGLPPGARAGEFLRHIARLHADPLDPGGLLERLGLHEHERSSVRRLSGGLRQRLVLATALVGRPKVVFLDEPSTGLDPQARLAVWDVVREITADGAAVILTTHLMDEAEALADRIVILDHGRVIADGTPADLLAGAAAPGRPAALMVRWEMPPTEPNPTEPTLTEPNPDPIDPDRLTAALSQALTRALATHGVSTAGPDEVAPGWARYGDVRLEPAVLQAVAAWALECTVRVRAVDDGGQGAQHTPGRAADGGLEQLFLTLTGRSLR